MRTSTDPWIAVCLDTRYAPARARALGVADYAHRQGWRIELCMAEGDAALPFLKRWRGDGVLSFRGGPELIRYLRHRGLPQVEMSHWRDAPPPPFVSVDDRALARISAEHLVRPCCHSYGFCGIAGNPVSQRRRRTGGLLRRRSLAPAASPGAHSSGG